MRRKRISGLFPAAVLMLALFAPAAWGADLIVYPESESFEETDLNYTLVTVSIEIPGDYEITEAINESLQETIYQPQRDDLQSVRDRVAEGVVYGPYSVNSELVDDYTQGNLFSVLVYSDSYAGGPHGWGHYISATYDLTSGEPLGFDEILTGSEAREYFADLMEQAWLEDDVITQLLSAGSYTVDEICEMARRSADNIDSDAWTFCESGLRVNYPGGDYVFYAAGPLEIEIPYEWLSGVVKTDYLPSGLGNNETTQPGLADFSGQSSGNRVLNTYTIIRSDMSWQKASEDAKKRGGHLATITSKEEQDEIERLLNQTDLHTVWLGGQRSGGGFTWVTGEEFSWTNWAKGEPNNDTGDENYMDMYKNTSDVWGWNDVPGDISQYYSGRMGYVLEIELASQGQ